MMQRMVRSRIQPECARLISVAAKAGAAAILTVGLFGLSPDMPQAQAAFRGPVFARLVFSPTNLGPQPDGSSDAQVNNICARNLSSVPVTVEFQVDIPAAPGVPEEKIHFVEIIPPDDIGCVAPAITLPPHIFQIQMVAAIVLQSPPACSFATQYPGPCLVLGSLEISNNGFSNRIHMEPVLVPGSPGSQPPTP